MARTYHPTVRIKAGDGLDLDGTTYVVAERDGDKLRLVDDLGVTWMHVAEVSGLAREGDAFTLVPRHVRPDEARLMAEEVSDR